MRTEAQARKRFGALLGAWRSGWTREKNLLGWLARAVRVGAPDLGLALSAEGAVCGDHLVAVLNRALQTLSAPHALLEDARHPPLTVGELRRLIADQPTRRLYYTFAPETGRLVVGCFHGYARACIAAARPCPDAAPRPRLQRTPRLERRVPETDEALEGWLMRWLAAQPLDALHFTYRYVLGELWLTRHAPPLAYRPVEAPLLLDDVGAPLAACEGAVRAERLYHALGERYGDVLFHDTVAAHVGAILERGLVPAAPHAEVYLWSWTLCPARARRRHDARFYVDLRRAVREGGLRFFMAHDGTVICPSPIPMRFLELAEPPAAGA